MLFTHSFDPVVEIYFLVLVEGWRTTQLYTTLYYSTQHYTALQHSALHHTTLHNTVLQHTTLHCTTAHCSAPRNTKLRCTTAHYTTLHYSTVHCTTEHYTTLYYSTLHYTALQHSALHHRTLHYTALQHTTLRCTTVSQLVGALSPVSHKGSHQGWTQTSIYLKVIHFTSHHTTSCVLHSVGTQHTSLTLAGWPILSAGLHRNHMLATANTGKIRTGFGKMQVNGPEG